MTLESNNNYYDITLSNLDLESQCIQDISFEKVVFDRCNFQSAQMESCSFIDCTFSHCNLSLIQATKSSFVNISFVSSKLVGVNWKKIQGSLGISLSFEDCNLNYSSFVDISFVKSKLYNCQVCDVDFFDSDLRKCDCRDSVFTNSSFSNTNLQQADFRGAKDYFINIFENQKNLKGAKFSSIEVENLFKSLDIEIE